MSILPATLTEAVARPGETVASIGGSADLRERRVEGGDVGDDRPCLRRRVVGRLALRRPVVGIDDELPDGAQRAARVVARGPGEVLVGAEVAHRRLDDAAERGEVGLARVVGAHEREHELEPGRVAERVAPAPAEVGVDPVEDPLGGGVAPGEAEELAVEGDLLADERVVGLAPAASVRACFAVASARTASQSWLDHWALRNTSALAGSSGLIPSPRAASLIARRRWNSHE